MKITWKIAVLGMICFFFHITTVCPVWADTSENPAISVTPAFQSVDRSSGSTTFEVSNAGTDTLTWNAAVVSGDDWLTITEGNSGTDAGTISCEYEANTIASPRTATIQITVDNASESPVTVMVIQAGDGNAVLDSIDWVEVLKTTSGRTSDMDAVFDVDIDGDGKIGVEEAIFALQSMSRTREAATGRAVLAGPLVGANVSVYRLADLETPIYQTLTDVNGYFHTHVTGFSRDDVLLVKVSGGIDTGDDQAIVNQGTIHALINGSDWIKGNFYVSVISDLAWQYTGNLVGETDTAGIERRLDELANSFFQRTGDDSLVSGSDFFTFCPLDSDQRNELNFDYSILGKPDDDGLSLIHTYHQNLSDARGSLLDSFFGERSTRFPVADSQEDKVKLTVAVLGEGRVTSDDNTVEIDTGAADPTSNVASVFYDPTDDKTVVLTAIPTSDTEVVSWQGCDTVSEDGTRCTVRMRTDHLVTLSFGYKETLLDSTIQLVDLSKETVDISQGGITLDVTLTSGDLPDLDSVGQGDVVVSRAGNGFLRRIVTINKQSAGQYLITTEEVALEEIVSRGTGTLHKEMTHGDLVEPAGMNRTTGSISGAAPVTGVETVDGVRMLPGKSMDDKVFKFIVGDQPTDTRAPMSEIGGGTDMDRSGFRG